MINTVVRGYKKWSGYHRSVKELSMLSSRELSDLGISRNEIRAIARRAAV
ncbi:MAG: DUF1127 domain-containing protein [Rhodobacteraceae bacterium]|nr:DUF1127 domain-containing protein [Paracoccaceae bacterium]